LHSFGQLQKATRTLRKLSTFDGLPPDVSEETHVEMAQLLLAQQHYAKARRHLAILLAQDPENAAYYHQMGRAHDLDKEGSPTAALQCYRRSLEIDPDQPQCLCDFGLLAIAIGDDEEEGISALHQAAGLAPDDPEIIAKVIEGLGQADRDEEAARLLRAAMFRNSRDPKFQQLWSRFQFQQLQREQELWRARLTTSDQEANMILPFEHRPVGAKRHSAPERRTRRDKSSAAQPPHFPGPARLPRKKRA
jgi:tetratricopeptide (TPR) repeat protein